MIEQPQLVYLANNVWSAINIQTIIIISLSLWAIIMLSLLSAFTSSKNEGWDVGWDVGFWWYGETRVLLDVIVSLNEWGERYKSYAHLSWVCCWTRRPSRDLSSSATGATGHIGCNPSVSISITVLATSSRTGSVPSTCVSITVNVVKSHGLIDACATIRGRIVLIFMSPLGNILGNKRIAHAHTWVYSRVVGFGTAVTPTYWR